MSDQEERHRRGKVKKKWLIAGLLAAVTVVEVVAPQWLPLVEVIAEAVEPSVWGSPEPLPAARQ